MLLAYLAICGIFAGLLPLLAWVGRLPRLSGRDAVAVAAVGLLMTTCPYAALFWGEQHVSSGTAAFLVSTAPIFTTLIAAARGETPLRLVTILGLATSVGGTAVIIAARPLADGGSSGPTRPFRRPGPTSRR